MPKGYDAQLYGVDMLKYIMAFAVIAIHVSPIVGQDYNSLFTWFIRLAVPFFFITSGYLMGRKLRYTGDDCRQVLSRRAAKVFRMFGCWLLIYLPVALSCWAASERPVWRELVRYLGNVVLCGESDYAWHLWFLYSMGIVLLIVRLCAGRKNSLAWLTVMFTAVAVFNGLDDGVWGSGKAAAAARWINTVLSRTLGGGIYICAGMIIARHADAVMKWRNAAVLISASLAVFYAGLPLWAVLGGAGLFVVAVKAVLRESDVLLELRYQSMWIYFIHMYVLLALVRVCDACGYAPGVYGMLFAACVVTGTVAFLVSRLSRSGRFRWLQGLVK